MKDEIVYCEKDDIKVVHFKNEDGITQLSVRKNDVEICVIDYDVLKDDFIVNASF